MKNNQAYVYYYQTKSVSIYVNLAEYEQMIFYWDLKTRKQKRPPRWRLTRQDVDIPAEIISYNTVGCVMLIEGRRAEFHWTHADVDKDPTYRGELSNVKDWTATVKTYINSPTSSGIYTGIHSGHYSQPQEYEPD
jgi:hypothetical protein